MADGQKNGQNELSRVVSVLWEAGRVPDDDCQPKNEEQRQIAARWVAHHQREHELNPNPLRVWFALAEVLAYELPCPDWIGRYLLDVALGMRQLTHEPPRKGKVAPALSRLLGFTTQAAGKKKTGAVNYFVMAQQEAHELMIAMTVYQCHTRQWHKQRKGVVGEGTPDWGHVFEDAAAEHSKMRCHQCAGRRRPLSRSTVERVWRKHALTVIPPHLIDRAGSRKVDDILK